MENKYVVIKQSDWEQLNTDSWGISPSTVRTIEQIRINDAFVLRLQDSLATGALYAYASSVQTAIEILQTVDLNIGDGDERFVIIEQLKSIRDAAFEWAERGRVTQGKLPD
jgi:hypothetical protein